MSNLRTQPRLHLKPAVEPAAGLHDPQTRRTYLFRDFSPGLILIGRSKKSDIQLPDPRVSRSHAIVKRYADGRVIIRNESVNETYVDGNPIHGASPLMVGMHIHLGGEAFLVATNAEKTFPVEAFDIEEYCYYAVQLHGGKRRAAQYLGKKSRKFIVGAAKDFLDREDERVAQGGRLKWRRGDGQRPRSNKVTLCPVGIGS